MSRAAIAAAVLAVVSITGVAHVAVAQGDQVRIVQAGDGSVYLLKTGTRYAIVTDAIDDDELASYADAGSIGTSQVLAALSAPTASVTDAAARVAPPAEADQLAPPPEAAQSAPPPPAADQPAGAPLTQPQACATQPARAKGSAACSAQPTSAAVTPHFVANRGVAAGGSASISFVSAPGTTCSLQYQPPSGTLSAVGEQTADANGVLTWTFPAGPRAGVGTLVATCGDVSINNTIQIGGSGAVR
jgi:hypothetical protein